MLLVLKMVEESLITRLVLVASRAFFVFKYDICSSHRYKYMYTNLKRVLYTYTYI